MTCENPSCHCQHEVGVVRDGREICSEHCRPASANLGDLCHCGHLGCQPLDDSEPVQGDLHAS
jgi:hypothetical protein